MYNRMLLPLDGSKTAEKGSPYARFLTRTLKLPVELLRSSMWSRWQFGLP